MTQTRRALQAAFRRHRDTTPLQYARTVRLERGRHPLGLHPSRFSTDYRTAYGVSPSHTPRT